jgi:hypothetical protein
MPTIELSRGKCSLLWLNDGPDMLIIGRPIKLHNTLLQLAYDDPKRIVDESGQSSMTADVIQIRGLDWRVALTCCIIFDRRPEIAWPEEASVEDMLQNENDDAAWTLLGSYLPRCTGKMRVN